MKALKYLLILILSTSISYAEIVLSSPQGAAVQRISEAVLKVAYKNIGVPVSFIQKPGERSLFMSNTGKVDGEISRIKGISKKYNNLLIIPVAINHLEGVVFTKDIRFDVNGWDSIKAYKIGIVRGSKFVEKGTKGMNVHMVSSYTQVFKLLNKGKIDIVVAPYLAGNNSIKKLDIKGITVLKPAIVNLKLYHYLNKKNVDLVEKLKIELETMEKNGLIDNIRKEYISNH